MVNRNMIDLGQIYGLTGNNANRYMYANTSDVVNIPSLEDIANAHQMNRNQSMTTGVNDNNIVPSSSIQAVATPMSDLDGINSGNRNSSETATGSSVPISSPMRVNLTTEESAQPIEEHNQPFQSLLVDAQSIQYLNSFARTQIGRMVQVNFMMGTNTVQTLEGTLLGVGTNFLLINERGTRNVTACDFYNVKYIRFFY
jgi:hypothetical protein